MKIYLAKIVPIAYIVSIVTACYISDKVSSYFVFLNSVELTSVNLDSLRSLKAPSESITYAFKTSLSGPTCSKYALPKPRDTIQQPSQQYPPQQQLQRPQPQPTQVQPEGHLENNERTLIPMVKALMEEVKACRDEIKLLSDKVTSLADPIQRNGETNSIPSSTVQSSEHISPARKKTPLLLLLQQTLQTC